MSVYFHANFGLNRANMTGILKAALKDPSKRDNELAAPFGLGPAFAARTRSWLNKTGIAEQEFPVRLTKQVKEIWENDPKLGSIETQWFMHCELTTDPQRAEVWHYFIHEFLPANPTFTRDDLLMGITELLRQHSEDHFGPGKAMNKVITRKLLDCYCKTKALGDLNILACTQDGKFSRAR